MSSFSMNINTNQQMPVGRQSGNLLEYLLVGHPDAGVHDKVMKKSNNFLLTTEKRLLLKPNRILLLQIFWRVKQWNQLSSAGCSVFAERSKASMLH